MPGHQPRHSRRFGAIFALLLLTLVGAPPLASAVAEGHGSSAMAPSTAIAPSNDPTATIIGGRDATQVYPWNASLGYLGMHTCGGALIAPRWVVTAKHCLGGGLQPGDDVRLGSNTLFTGGELRKVKTEIAHPSMDFGLIELDAAASKTPIRIADNVGAMGQATRILGWGSTQADGGGPTPSYLKELDTSVVSVNKCGEDGVTNYGNEFCTNNPGGNTGACFGDSGGPQIKLVNGTWELIGNTSRGPDICGSTGSVYMSVPTFTQWIYDKTGGAAGRTTIGGNTTGDPNLPGGPGPTSSPTATPTSTPTANPGGLPNGQPVAISGATGSWKSYTVSVPSGASNLTITMAGGSGDADLYVKQGSTVSKTLYDCRPYQAGNNETCTVASPIPGTYSVGIAAYTAFSGATLTASWSTASPGPTATSTPTSSPTVTPTAGPTTAPNALLNGVPRTVNGASGTFTYFQIALPSGRSSLTVTISGGTGDADLYLRSGSQPTTTAYACRPYQTGNAETCTISGPTGGTWWVGVRGFTSYSGVTLRATW